MRVPQTPYPRGLDWIELYCRLDRPVLSSIFFSAFDSTALGRINASFSKRGTTRLRLPPFTTVFFCTTYFFVFLRFSLFRCSITAHTLCLSVWVWVYHPLPRAQKKTKEPTGTNHPASNDTSGVQVARVPTRVACPPNVFVLL